ncbi:hypothetical protein F0562_029390 [Nyssa sinensis]|uniref:Uncharacterized protein n=1 Tax=Nyssa sinensis TaxID=561372 RepID=A0A5J5B4W4_9ASTE|nr:hypothetical protein F0562_029390 [Nyssa sinensis]
MCGKRELFSQLDNNFREKVKLGNDTSLTVQGKGNVQMEINGIVQVIIEVFFVPELKNDLLSIGQLQEKGLSVLMQHRTCKIYHLGKGIIMETEMACNRMFAVLGRYPPKEESCFSSMTTDQTQLWHRRYGHLHWNGLKVIQQKNMVDELPQWNWDDSHKETILAELEWEEDQDAGTNGSLGEETEANITSEDELENIGSVQSDSLEGGESSNNGSPLHRGGVRRPPGWMQDYVTGQGLSDEENVVWLI